MNDAFVVRRESNYYDRLTVNVPGLYAAYPLADRAQWTRTAPQHSLSPYRQALIPFSARLTAWKLLHRLRLDTRWFDRFQTYWSSILKGRPLLSVDDFHFLRGVYRLRHQDNQVPDTDDAEVHTAAWQQPELLYQLFFQVYLESLHPRIAAAQWLHKVGARSFCEYGCATAPVAAAYDQFYGRIETTLIDLPTVALHYAAYRFSRRPDVEIVALDPLRRLLPPEGLKVNAIVCLTVFEHLLDPLAVARRFIEILKPGGHLIFDYFSGEGGGLDTRQGVEQRDAVLALIADRFEVINTEPRTPIGAGLTVARIK